MTYNREFYIQTPLAIGQHRFRCDPRERGGPTTLCIHDKYMTYDDIRRRTQIASKVYRSVLTQDQLFVIDIAPSFELLAAVLGAVHCGITYLITEETMCSGLLSDISNSGTAIVVVKSLAIPSASRVSEDSLDKYPSIFIDKESDFMVDNCLSGIAPQNLALLTVDRMQNGVRFAQFKYDAIAEHILWMKDNMPFESATKIGIFTAIRSIDTQSLLLSALLNETSIKITQASEHIELEDFANSLSNEQFSHVVTDSKSLTALLYGLSDIWSTLSTLKYWVIIDEIVTEELKAHFYATVPNVRLINLYRSIEMLGHRVEIVKNRREPRLEFSWGKPLIDSDIHIINTEEYIPSDDTFGELIIGSNNEQLISRKLVGTNDLGHRLPGGRIELSRIASASFIATDAVGTIEEAGDELDVPPDLIMIERTLLNLWQEILGLQNIDIDDNFFELGGYSLAAAHLIASTHEVLRVRITFQTLMSGPTIRQLSHAIWTLSERHSNVPLQSSLKLQQSQVSFGQQRIWMEQEMVSAGHCHVGWLRLQTAHRIKAEPLQKALDELSRRHEILRTNVVMRDGVLWLSVRKFEPVNLNVYEMQEMTEKERALEIEQITHRLITSSVDLTSEAPVRAAFFNVGEHTTQLLILIPELLCHRRTNRRLVEELDTLYSAFEKGETPSLPSPRIQYTDFAHWQHNYHKVKSLSRQRDFWFRELQDCPPCLAAPTDYPRRPIKYLDAASEKRVMSHTIEQGCFQLAANEEVTLYVLLLTVFKILLCRLIDETHIAVATEVSTHERLELQGLIGFFMNRLVMRTDLVNAKTFRESLSLVKKTVLNALDNQDFPLEGIVEELGLPYSQSYETFSNVMFTIQHMWTLSQDGHPISLEGSIAGKSFELKSFGGNTPSVPFRRDLVFLVGREVDGMALTFKYDPTLFGQQTAKTFLWQFENILTRIIKNPNVDIWEIDLNPPAKTCAIQQDIMKVDEIPGSCTEIESIIAGHADVDGVRVISINRSNNKCDVYAFLVLNRNPDVIVHELLGLLRVRIPEQDIPTKFYKVKDLPSVNTGIIDDEEKLLENTAIRLSDNPIPATDEIGNAVGNVWQDVLDRNSVGIHDNFFTLGGSVVQAVEVVNRLNALYKTNVSCSEFIACRTMSCLGALVRRKLELV